MVLRFSDLIFFVQLHANQLSWPETLDLSGIWRAAPVLASYSLTAIFFAADYSSLPSGKKGYRISWILRTA